MTTVAEQIVTALADRGIRQVWGVVGDALNPVTDAIRREDRIAWIGVRHEEAGAFAASAQAQLTDDLAVCMGTVGPGSVHLLNGLYDAKKSHAPVLAICGQVPLAEIGSSFFQEVDNDALFADVAVYCHTVTSVEQMPHVLEQAVNAAVSRRGVAVVTLPGDIGGLELPKDVAPTHFAPRPAAQAAARSDVQQAARILSAAKHVTLLVGTGARGAHDRVLEVADKLAAPMVLTLKAKEGFDGGNPYAVGQTGLIGNPAAVAALEDADVVLMLGTDFPYRDWYPAGKQVIQLDVAADHIGRRVSVQTALVGDCDATLADLLPLLDQASDRGHLEKAQQHYRSWQEGQQSLAEPRHDRKLLGRLRSVADNPDDLIRPEALAAALDRHAAPDATFTSDTGMSTVWLSRLIPMTGTRRLIGSYNLGSMANAMPQALGASALDPGRQVIALCGDGGLMMLLGDLRTAVTYDLPVKLMVFDNGRLGMVKLEQEQGGLPEFGTVLDNPDLAAVATAMGLSARRVEAPGDLDDAVSWALATDGPVLLDVLTNPDEVSVPPKATAAQAWGFAIAKLKEQVTSPS